MGLHSRGCVLRTGDGSGHRVNSRRGHHGQWIYDHSPSHAYGCEICGACGGGHGAHGFYDQSEYRLFCGYGFSQS